MYSVELGKWRKTNFKQRKIFTRPLTFSRVKLGLRGRNIFARRLDGSKIFRHMHKIRKLCPAIWQMFLLFYLMLFYMESYIPCRWQIDCQIIGIGAGNKKSYSFSNIRPPYVFLCSSQGSFTSNNNVMLNTKSIFLAALLHCLRLTLWQPFSTR